MRHYFRSKMASHSHEGNTSHVGELNFTCARVERRGK